MSGSFVASAAVEAEAWGSRRIPKTAFRQALAAAEERLCARREGEVSVCMQTSGLALYKESLSSLAIAREEAQKMEKVEEALQSAVLALETGQSSRKRASSLAVDAEMAFYKSSTLAELLRDGARSAKSAASVGQSTTICKDLCKTLHVTEEAACTMEAEAALLDKRSSTFSLRASLEREKERELELSVMVHREKLKIARHQALCNSAEAFSAFIEVVSAAYEVEDASGGSCILDSVIGAITRSVVTALHTAANSAHKL